jgi:hypothetical protein
MRAGVRSQESESRRKDASAGLSINTLLQRFYLASLCALLLLPAGCTLKASRAGIPLEAQATIDAATSNIADGNYEKIYTEAADEWRLATTLEESNATFKQLKERLGNVKGRSFHSATEQDTTGAHSFIITYKTSFDRADGMETFTLVEREGRWLLARYFVNSEALK